MADRPHYDTGVPTFMAITYRLMRRDDEAAVLDLWTTVYPGTDRRQWQREWRSIPHCFDHTHVAVAADGTLLATAHYWVRTMRDVHGVPAHVGHVSHLATRPTARRQGHAGTLLKLTIAAMQRDRCAWSLLFTSAEAQSLYAHYGWRSFPTRYRQGTLADQQQPLPPEVTVRRLDPRSEPDDWDGLAAVYAAYNQRRPLSVVRDLPYWHGYLQMPISNWLDSARSFWEQPTRRTGARLPDTAG